MHNAAADDALEDLLRSTIRNIEDYPKQGIVFRDVTPVMTDANVFAKTVDALCAPWQDAVPDKIAGIEARGFIFAAAMAVRLGAGFVPIRKHGKLPWKTVGEDYALEYGQSRIEMHIDMVNEAERVLLVDDLLATGGTMAAALSLLEQVGAETLGVSCVVDLPELGGRQRLAEEGLHVHTLVAFDGA